MASAEDVKELYARYSQTVYRRACELLGNADAARDATQEVFVRVMRAGGRVPAEPTPTAWLHRVTTNLCLNRLRDRNRRREILDADYQAETATPAVGEPRAIVLNLLSRVPEELQDVAVYFFLDELTYEEISQLLGVSKRTVSNRLAAFREMVGSLFPERMLAS